MNLICENLENLKSFMMVTVHIATIAIVLERFLECAVALHLTSSFNKFTKLIKKKILPVMDSRTCSRLPDFRNYQRNSLFQIGNLPRKFSILDPFKVDQLITQNNNQSVMELMDRHQNSLELIQWNKTMEFGVSHMCLSVERKVVTSDFDLK